jgi:chemotaxis receptor (MCP) glutamine deamidase CheD
MSVQSEIHVASDSFEVARASVLLVAELRAALAICVHDDTQGAGGLLNLKYVATSESKSVDLTDNTLSSTILLMDRFCKELRALGARKQSWRVNVFAHAPELPNIQDPAATVIDLIKAYFADSRHAVECEEFHRPGGIVVRLDAREGRCWVSGLSGTAATVRLAAPA